MTLKPVDIRGFDYFAELRRLDRALLGGVHLERI